jgi:hypothetical protein
MHIVRWCTVHITSNWVL